MFELKDRDAAGRIGILKLGKRKVETPAIFTVVNPNKLVIPPKELKEKFKLDLMITNSYIIWNSETLREKAINLGLHKLLDFDGMIMTDSGAFQLYAYGKVDVDNATIIDFQQKIQSDLGVILDVPKYGMRSEVKSALEITIKRTEEWMKIRESSENIGKMGWAGPIQGAEYPDLLEKSAKFMAKLPFDVYALGTCVPYLEKYEFGKILQNIITCKKLLPPNKPLHTFGAGLPQFFALAVAAGSDLFDSAAYVLYAENNRYMTLEGVKSLGKMEYLPCSCPICSKYSAKDLKESPNRVELLARHNLWVTVKEIKTIKQAIREGRLFELVEQRCRAHPKLLEALTILYDNSKFLENFDPVSKRSAFFYSGKESLRRPAVLRYQEKLMKRFLPASKTVSIRQTPIGIIPKELEGIYPQGQCEFPDIEFNWDKSKFLKKYGLKEGNVKVSLGDQLRARVRFQFGEGGEKLLDDAKLEISRNTKRVRRIRKNEEILATIRPSDGFIVPTELGANILHKNIKGMRVVVSGAEDFILKGNSVMAKFVVDADPEIRPKDEVLVVDKKGKLLGAGLAFLNRNEMLAFDRGIAVKIRTKFEPN
jgi:7-cyano-7-deazaguanine tRNA-ribosyltransferase